MKRKWMIPVILTAALTGTLLGACGTDTGNPDESRPAPHQQEQKVRDGSLGVDYRALFGDDEMLVAAAEEITDLPAPDFTVTGMDGKKLKLSDLKGEEVILEFAQSTCGACQHSHAAVEQFSTKHPDVQLLQIFDFEKEGAKAYANLTGADESTLFDGDGSVSMKYNAMYTPTFIFIDKEGVVRYVTVGAVEPDVLEGHYNFFSFSPDDIVKE